MKRHALLWATGLAALGVLHALHWAFVSDDAFIALRYVQQLLAGNGLVFNEGERVEGYSSLLWLLLVAGPGLLGADLLLTARVLGVAAGVGCVLAVTALARRSLPEGSRLVLLPALVLAASGPIACWSASGLETPLHALLLLAALLLVELAGRRPRLSWAAGAALGALAVTRPEGALMGLVLVLAHAVEHRGDLRRTGRLLLPFVAIVAAQLAFRLGYYGELLPNPWYAKVDGARPALWARGLGYLDDFARESGGRTILLVPLLALLWRRDRIFLGAAALLVVGGLAVVWVGGDGLPMHRFAVPLIPLWSLVAAGFLSDAGAWLASRFPSGARLGAALGALVALVLVVVGVRPREDSRAFRLFRDHRDHEVPAWTAVGRWLAAEGREGDSVACVPVGAISYYSGLRVIDMMGITDSHIARVEAELGGGWAGHEKRDGAYVLSREPTFLLLGNVQVLDRALPFDDPTFARPGDPVTEAREGDVWGDPRIGDYRRAHAALPGGLCLHYLRRRDR